MTINFEKLNLEILAVGNPAGIAYADDTRQSVYICVYFELCNGTG